MEQDSERSARESLGDDIDAIFEFWKVRHGFTRAKLDAKRRSKIRQRLCDRYTRQDLMDAVEGCALSPFHMGSNDRHAVYNDIELICRDAKHVDMFIQLKLRDDAAKAKAAARAKAQREAEERERIERQQRAAARANGAHPLMDHPMWMRRKTGT